MNQRLFSITCCSLALLFTGIGIAKTMAQAATSHTTYSWMQPVDLAIKKVASAPTIRTSPQFLNNTDCTELTMRLSTSNDMQSGCFTNSAFGMVNTDNGLAIFNGTDEAVPMIPYLHQGVIAPWTNTGDLLTLVPDALGGVRVGVYRDPAAHLTEHRNLLGQLVSKELITPPDFMLSDEVGKILTINPQTLTFSGTGNWLVAETLQGYFIRINLATLDMQKFTKSFMRSGTPGFLDSNIAITNDGRYVAINNEDAASLSVYDLENCTQSDGGVSYQQCPSRDYRSFINQQISNVYALSHLRFTTNDSISFQALYKGASSGDIYLLSPDGQVDNLTGYIGMGDSFTSGEGAFDYIVGTDTPNNHCHLSSRSYPLLLTADLFGSSNGHSVACSGATIKDVGGTSLLYTGQVSDGSSLQSLEDQNPVKLSAITANYLPGYIAQHRFLQQYQPRLATISVGGDDIGFGDMVETCVEPHISIHANENTCYNTYEDRLAIARQIDKTIPKWVDLYRQVQQEAPSTTFFAIGYPDIVNDSGSCGLNVHLNKSELEFAVETVHYLNDAIQKAASQANIMYVDVEGALQGHRLCEGKSSSMAVNGLTAGTDAGALGVKVFGHESYHPNAYGQELLEQAILTRTNNLKSSVISTRPKLAQTAYTDKPKAGGIVYDRSAGHLVTQKQVTVGSSLSFSTVGTDYGLRAGSAYQVRLDGPLGLQIGQVLGDDHGAVSGAVRIPPGTTPGGHTIDIIGPGPDENPIHISEPIYTGGSDHDSDGDGQPDATDTCPGSVNSGIDNDHDGVDDSCDPVISDSGSQTSTPQQNDGMNDSHGDSIIAIPSVHTVTYVPAANSPAAVELRAENQKTIRSYKISRSTTVDPQTIAFRRSLFPPKTNIRQKPALPRLPFINWILVLFVTSLTLYSFYQLGRYIIWRKRRIT